VIDVVDSPRGRLALLPSGGQGPEVEAEDGGQLVALRVPVHGPRHLRRQLPGYPGVVPRTLARRNVVEVHLALLRGAHLKAGRKVLLVAGFVSRGAVAHELLLVLDQQLLLGREAVPTRPPLVLGRGAAVQLG